MEKLQGPINPCLLQEELGMGCLEDENGALDMSLNFGQFLGNFEDPYLEDKMPFLQMLQGVESHQQQQQTQNPFFPLMQEPNFQLLLKLQHQKSITNHHNNQSCLASVELESCVTNNNDIVMDLQSPLVAQISTLDVEKLSPKNSSKGKKSQFGKLSGGPVKEKRKRKRSTTKPSKNKEEVESQRMTHIAVERNRRRQMNEHLNALRSLMPPSYVQRGDQASIIGGAIDFVKELEQLLQSLEAQKRMRQSEENGDVSASSTTSSSSNLFGNLFMGPSSSSSLSTLQYKYPHSHHDEGNGDGNENGNENENEDANANPSIEGGKINQELSAENRSALADIQVMVIQNHVNLKIRCQRRPGQLLNAIVALEQLRFSVLHLNITSLHSFVYYSFNLKIEEDCKLGSADEVASAVHQIFRVENIYEYKARN